MTSEYLNPIFHYCLACLIQTALIRVVIKIWMLKRVLCHGVSINTLILALAMQGIVGFTCFYCTSWSETWLHKANSRNCFASTCRSHMRLKVLEIRGDLNWDWRVYESYDLDSVLVQPSWGMFSNIILFPSYSNVNLCVHLLCLENWMHNNFQSKNILQAVLATYRLYA